MAKIIVTENQLKTISGFIFEASFTSVLSKIKTGYDFIIHQGSVETLLKVINVYGNEVKLQHASGKEITIFPAWFYENKLEMEVKSETGKKTKSVLKNVDYIEIKDKDKTIDRITPSIGAKSDDKGEEFRLNFIDFINNLNENESFKIVSGMGNQPENEFIFTIIAKTNTEVYLELSDVSEAGATSFKEKISGYNVLVLREGNIISNTIILEVVKGEDIEKIKIPGIIDFEEATTRRDDEEDEETKINKSDVIKLFLKDPVLKNLYYRQPKILGFIPWGEPEGIIPFLKKVKAKEMVKLRGNNIKFRFLSKTIGIPSLPKFRLIKDEQYVGRLVSKNKVIITSVNRRNKFIINLIKKIGDEYDVNVVLQVKDEAGRIDEYKFMGRIKIIETNR